MDLWDPSGQLHRFPSLPLLRSDLWDPSGRLLPFPSLPLLRSDRWDLSPPWGQSDQHTQADKSGDKDRFFRKDPHKGDNNLNIYKYS